MEILSEFLVIVKKRIPVKERWLSGNMSTSEFDCHKAMQVLPEAALLVMNQPGLRKS